MRGRSSAFVVLVAVSTGCTGLIGGDDDRAAGGGEPTNASNEANIDAGLQLAPLGLPRLSAAEYAATLKDVLRAAAPSVADDVMRAIAPTLQNYPSDQLTGAATEKHGGFARLDQTQQQGHADVPFTLADEIARALTRSPDRVAALVGPCAADASPGAAKTCASAFVRTFGELVLRRPPSDDDLAFYTGRVPDTGSLDAAAVAELVTILLASPRFLFHVESGDQSTGPNTYRLDAWELASRLSYHFWGTMPDAELRDAARSGALLDEATYAKQVERLYADPRTDATMRTFFQQWFWPVLELPALEGRVGNPAFDAFAGSNKPSPTLRKSMVDEVLDAASFVVSRGGSMVDLLTNKQAFARSAELAAIYGTPAWDGASPPASLPPERVGLLSRAAFLATGTATTRPIMRGVFIRTTLLCEEIPPPPANVSNGVAALAANLTTREEVEQITEQPGSNCAGCHKPFINPLGFAAEGFDALGRVRTTQRFFDAMGNLTGEKPVDTRSVPNVIGSDMRPSSGLGDLTQQIAESGKLESCFARRYFRYAFRTLEDRQRDAVILDDLTTHAKSGKPLADVLKLVAFRPEWKQRLINP